jgi:Zn-dependent oligopeptidase
MAKNPETV